MKRTRGRREDERRKSVRMSALHPVKGTTLLETLMAIAMASLLTLTLLLLFIHSRKIFAGEGNASEELRSLGLALHAIEEKLSEGSVYLVKADPDFLTGKPSSQITIEQFSSLYHSDQIVAFVFLARRLIEKDYPAVNGFSLAQALQKPDRQIVLASPLESATFTLNPPNTLTVTLQGEHLILQTEIPNIKLSLEGSR